MTPPSRPDFTFRPSAALRIRLADQTFGVASQLAPSLGISRLIDACATDVLGAPVWFAERPAGIASTLHCGKGLTSFDAQVGALMEAIEYAVAERDAKASDGASWSLGDIVRQFDPPITIADFAPIVTAPVHDDCFVLADACEDVADGRTYRLPAELLRVPSPEPPDGVRLFGWSSTGLASGNSVDEATLHGLLEVLERDCVAMDLVHPSTQWIALDTLPHPLDAWAARWASIGVELHVRHLSNEFGLPCFEACVAEPGAEPPRAAYGWGLHPDRAQAVTRAVTEAAQTRLHVQHDRSSDAHPIAVFPTASGESPRRRSIPLFDVPDFFCDGVEGTLEQLRALLHRAGLPWVLRRRLTCGPDGPDLGGLAVVKVVVPGCESAISRRMRIGRRLAERLLESV